VATASLSLKFVPPLVLTISDVMLKGAELCQPQDELDSARRLVAIEVKYPGDSHRPGVANICIMI
jgi:hypothetical protein